MIRHDQIKSIEPITVFGFDTIPGAIRYMRAGQHMGKVVIADRDSPSKVKVRKLPGSTSSPLTQVVGSNAFHASTVCSKSCIPDRGGFERALWISSDLDGKE